MLWWWWPLSLIVNTDGGVVVVVAVDIGDGGGHHRSSLMQVVGWSGGRGRGCVINRGGGVAGCDGRSMWWWKMERVRMDLEKFLKHVCVHVFV